jgi:hypothetical protein
LTSDFSADRTDSPSCRCRKLDAAIIPSREFPTRWRIEGDFLVLGSRKSDGPEAAASAIETVGSCLLRRLVA